ncbi:Dabb family protein [Domibacillus sp. PGB-M46]|uniref:Dabb family protein n=1 Tax=Domibacillus sp. PGB-M46 TaxID=2910255 RepID=UPI001F55CA75|nr:Dabb family protein [Domibacillus sp. PGB-M46]MCI2252861.1 Dabb family protein [Domibacillus sp. PGB-M46]
MNGKKGRCVANMYEHLVSFKFKEEVTMEKQQELALQLLKFQGEIPGIMKVTAGINATDEVEQAQGYTLGLHVTFKDKQSLTEYQTHPLHEKFLSEIEGLIDNVIVVDYEVAW